ncbi:MULTISPECIES: LuxR C-terminal-related transcriptional regulator [Pantoea]|uniref:helix-turn-helix transcriptional regulator n=1 Tax=Pantoea TaxID=53335 RepID=UPI00057D495F|nr:MULTISPECIES: LuxR C-terminal-related transcriptional regulator [Pantoea]
MKSKDCRVVVIGDNNILHYGLFSLIDTECSKRHLSVLSCKDFQQFRIHTPNRYSGYFHLAVLCLGCDDFFPCWFSSFLTLLRKTNGNVLVFTDSHVVLNSRKMSLLKRVCDVEYVVNVSMPVTYISFVLEHYLNRKRSLNEICKISQRELAVIDGFLNGVDAGDHSSKLGIETRTLYQHRKNCANKLGVRNLKDLLRL